MIYSLMYFAVPAVFAASGAAAVFGAVRVLGVARQMLRGDPLDHPAHCPRCRYDIIGIQGGRCPECGEDLSAYSDPAGRARKWMIGAERKLRSAALISMIGGFAILAVAGLYLLRLLAIWLGGPI